MRAYLTVHHHYSSTKKFATTEVMDVGDISWNFMGDRSNPKNWYVSLTHNTRTRQIKITPKEFNKIIEESITTGYADFRDFPIIQK